MSNFNAIGLIMVLVTAQIAIAIYVMAHIEDRNDTIVTGVRRGVPVSTRYRWMMLFYSTGPFLAALALYLFVSAFAFMEIAKNVSNENVGMLAYLCAGIAGFGSFSIVVQGSLAISYLVSVLRQTRTA